MRKSSAALITTLLVTASAAILLVESVFANPYTNSQYSGVTGAPQGAPLPVVSITSPSTEGLHNTGSLTLTFEASVENFSRGDYYSPLIRGMRIHKASYGADWLDNFTQIDLETYLDPKEGPNRVSVSLNLSEVPDGNHVIRVYVFAQGSIIDPFHWYTFETTGFSKAIFTVDTAPPNLTILGLENKTYYASNIGLEFIACEPSDVTYSLDGNENVTLSQNAVLSELTNGRHNTTFFAVDKAGNAYSKTIYFTVAEPFPTVPVVAVSAASIAAVIIAGTLLVRKRRKEAKQK